MSESQEITPLSATVPAAAVPQFSTAEYSHIPGSERCAICGNPIPSEYFRVNSLMACTQCASDARNGQPRDTHVAFSRGLLLGIGAAILGLAGYAAVVIITGWSIGYLALGVGWLVAKAIKKGSNGIGGRRYQIAAVLLTYAAISLAAVPIGISYAIKHAKERRQVQKPLTSAPSDSSSNEFPEQQSEAAAQQPPPASAPAIHLGSFVLQLLYAGLASPFLELQDPFHGAIGLLILFVGLRIAWQLTASAPLQVEGPYAQSAITA